MADGDNDKPQVTQPSNSIEPSGNLEHTVGTGFGRRVPSKTRTLDDGSAVIVQNDDTEARPETIRQSLERAFEEARNKQVEAAADSKPNPNTKTEANAAGATHSGIDGAVLAVSELLFLLFGLPFGDDLYHDKPIPPIHWIYLAIAVTCAIGGAMWPTIRNRWASPIVSASIANAARDARIWIAVLLVLFVYGTGPEIYQRAVAPPAPTADEIATATAPIKAKLDAANRQLQEAREKAKPLIPPEGVVSGRQVVNELKDLRAQVEELKHQNDALRQAVLPPNSPSRLSPLNQGPITWHTDSQLFLVSGGAPNAEVNGILIQGTSSASVTIKEAYVVSGYTGRKQGLMANVQSRGAYYPVDKVDIPPDAPVQLDLIFQPALPLRDFLDQWGKFHVTIVYNDGVIYERDFDETYVRQKIQQHVPNAFGPRVTPRDDK